MSINNTRIRIQLNLIPDIPSASVGSILFKQQI